MQRCIWLLVQGGSGEIQDYEVGKLAYGEEPQDTYVPSGDPADEEDEGDTTSGLYSLLINPVLPLNAKMHVSPPCRPLLGCSCCRRPLMQVHMCTSLWCRPRVMTAEVK